jgi:hypothetical protein
MKSKNCASFVGMLLVAVVVVSNSGCGGGSTPPISVTVFAGFTTLQAGATTGVTATVVNDSSNKGVTWTATCSAAQCGSASPTSTSTPDGPTTGDTTEYTTVYTAPPTPPATNLNVTLTATSVGDATKSASATVTVLSVAVTVAPATATVPSGGKQQFTATVTGDSSNGGVTWGLTGSYSCPKCLPQTKVLSCDSSCGTLSSAGTGSGTPVTYTAPPTKPSSSGNYSFDQFLLVATSAKNTLASASASIMLSPISVAVSPTSASVEVNATQQFTATVTNDGTKSGVTWTLMQTGAACSPGCGTIAPASTASGAAATYTPPATVPALPFVTVTATSVEDTTKSSGSNVTLTTATGGLDCGAGSGSESLLQGQYAFLLHGFDQSAVMFTEGSFTADGTGKITGGEEDIVEGAGSATDVNINPSGSSYAVGPDHRGCVVLANANGTTFSFRFALGSINSSSGIATNGHIIDFDDTTGSGARAAGSIRLQDATSFTASQFKGNYVFGLLSVQAVGAMAGTFNADGISAITSNTIDADFAGMVTSNVPSTPGGSFTCCSANGRGTLELDNSSLGLGPFAMYMINTGDVFLLEMFSSGSNALPSDIVEGEAIGIFSGTTFSQGSLSGVSVLRESAQSSTGPIVHIATASADGKGTITVNDNINNAGTFTTSSTVLNYMVASNGRVTLSGDSTPPVLYLYGQNQGFVVGTDPNGTFGILEPQAAGPFSNASLSGAYTFGTENPSASTVTMESGVVTADGNGNAAGTSDQSSSTGLAQNQALNLTYSFSANGTGNVGTNTTAILISGNKLVFINNTNANPTITVVEK